jgi:uncharacterized protein (TIGR03118 family)
VSRGVSPTSLPCAGRRACVRDRRVGSVSAANSDPHLINPWGVAFSPTGPFWVSDAGTGVTTIYDGTGAPFPVAGNHTVIDIAATPGQKGPSTPTGQVFNSTADGFQITAGGVTAKSAFIFVTTQGTISGWAPTVAGADSSVIAVDNSANNAAYTGVALSNTGTDDLLYVRTSAMARSMYSIRTGIW